MTMYRTMPLIIVGSGALAKETFYQLKRIKDPLYEPVAFFTEGTSGPNVLYGLPVLRELNTSFRHFHFVCAVGDVVIRRRLVEIALAQGMSPCMPIISDEVVMYETKIGMGSIVREHVILSLDVKIGEYCILNNNCTIGHDNIFGDFVTVGSGANISGNCTVGENTYIGTNACVKEKTNIGKNCMIGMGSVVIRHVADEVRIYPAIGQSLHPLKSPPIVE